MNQNQAIQEIFKKYRKIAVVGLSPDPMRPSYGVTQAMIAAGFDVVGVRPGEKQILGRPCYPSLEEVPGPLEIVNVFRKSSDVPSIVKLVLQLKAKALWLQIGVTHPEAERQAREAGLLVVSNACLKVEWWAARR